MRTTLACCVFLLAAGMSLPAATQLQGFVTRQGDQLMENGKPYRFVSFNIPNLHCVEDNVAFAVTNSWRWPDRFEITDALETVRQMGGQVARTYVISVVRTNEGPDIPRHVLSPGKFNEEGFRALDLVLQVANEKGVRIILPFVDNWVWWGGIAEYAGFRGKPKQAFWTDPQIIADFKETIRFVINRTNTLTGVPYREDPAILCWETGNELESPATWTREIAAYIKSLDSKHLVMDGFHTTELRAESLDIPEVDIVTTHHYPGTKKSYAQLAQENRTKAKGKRPYVVGEFGFVETPALEALLREVRENGSSGALIWSLRFRNRDGGFYWHSEPAGGNKYKAYHWPGFAAGAEYDEAGVMQLLKAEAFAIRSLPVPPLSPPATPRMLPVIDPYGITWQGSVGATSYTVERAPNPKGPWEPAGEVADETSVQYRPLFTETNAPRGRYYYRVRARNAAGESAYSAPAGPLALPHRVLLDEMADFTRTYSRQGTLEIRTHETRAAKEDMHRVAGGPGAELVYRLPGAFQGGRAFFFFPREINDPAFLVSTDGKEYKTVEADKELYAADTSDYGYWKPVLFKLKRTPRAGTYFKIQFNGEAQLGRLELGY